MARAQAPKSQLDAASNLLPHRGSGTFVPSPVRECVLWVTSKELRTCGRQASWSARTCADNIDPGKDGFVRRLDVRSPDVDVSGVSERSGSGTRVGSLADDTTIAPHTAFPSRPPDAVDGRVRFLEDAGLASLAYSATPSFPMPERCFEEKAEGG
jgi:hypothetical protein